MDMTATPAPLKPPVRAKRVFLDCQVEPLPSGEGAVTMVIPAEVMRRLRPRAGDMDLGEYLWTNLLRSALYGHVF